MSSRGGRFELHGHRGARGLRPENTLAGFAYALSVGVDALEIDVGMTWDGELVVHHDFALSPFHTRRAGEWVLDEPALYAMDLAQLRDFDVGRLRPGTAYAAEFPEQVAVDGAGVPTLRELIELVARAGNDSVRFNVEVKSTPEVPGLTASPETLAAALVALIEETGIGARTLVQSFDWRTTAAVQRLAPALPTGYTSAEQSWYDTIRRADTTPSPWLAGRHVSEFGGSVPRAIAALGGAQWMPYFGDVDEASLAEAHALGLRTMVWTVNEPGDVHALLDLGIDGITTDYPERVRAVLAERGMPLPAATPIAP